MAKANFVPSAQFATFIVRGSVHQAMLCDEDELRSYLEYNGLKRTNFVHAGGTPYERADVLYDDGSGNVCAELHKISHL